MNVDRPFFLTGFRRDGAFGFFTFGAFCLAFGFLPFFTNAAKGGNVEENASSAFRQVFPNRPNVVRFERSEAKFLRFKIFSSFGGAPAIDELLTFDSQSDESSNLSLIGVKRVDASSCISGYAIHRVENIVDGRFGNDASWVAADVPSFESPQWLSIEWDNPVALDSLEYSRDRNGAYSDRVPLDIEIELSNDGSVWRSVARVRGVTDDLKLGGLTEYGSPLNASAPISPAKEWIRPSLEDKDNESVDEYERSLRTAFLAEESALLKVAGFADCERGLIQRRYPEFVEPSRKPESIVPLPKLSFNDEDIERIAFDDPRFFDELASSETARVFAPGNFNAGPLLEQTVSAALGDGSLLVRIEGARFLSDNRAIVATENLPTRGFITVRDDKVLWKQIDSLDGRDSGAEFELVGVNDNETGVLKVAIPLAFLPEASTRGVYISLGIGGRNVLPGGRPIHFRPTDFTAKIIETASDDASFDVELRAIGNRTIRLATSTDEIQLSPNAATALKLKGERGQVGPEIVFDFCDVDSGLAYRLVGLRYDPCYRPLCQLKDSIERAESDSDSGLDIRDFEKRTLIPGAANPRYVDLPTLEKQLELSNEREELSEFFRQLNESDVADNDDILSSIKKRALAFWNERNLLIKERCDKFCDNLVEERDVLCLRERDLFWRIRLLKRELFLSNEELGSVEHILANKRRPFWPSHNYSDLFDSTWNPGGAVVLIDVPRENGRLAPEKATFREIVKADQGVIRNPSASFDASKIYYAFRENKDEYFRIFELDLNTGEKRRVSAEGPFHDFWPTELPDGGLAFVSTRCKKKFICWRPQAFVLFRMSKDGKDIRPLSFANLTEFAPSVADDGRILWTRSEYVDKGADYGHTLWTIRADGTSPELVFGNTINLPQGYANGRFVPDSQDVCCVMISHFGDLNGPVALLDRSKGPHDPSAIRSITPEVPWPGFWARSETFREPFPISRDVFMVSHAALDRFGIYLIDRFGNRELLTIDDSIDTVCPQPFGPREIPPVTGNPPDPELQAKGLGRFSIANVYRGLEDYVKPGTAKYLRICQEMPTPLAQLPDGTYQADHEPFMEYYASPVDVLQGAFGWTSYVAKGVLGTVRIEEDGSADFVAPAEKVLFFELLDENFNEIQRMRSVVQLQPGERRSCIGCHESRLSAPDGGLPLASERDSQEIVPPSWGAGPFWYERVVQPILDKRCIECHTRETALENPKQLDLTGTRDDNRIPSSYRSLIQSGDVHYFDYTWGAGKTTKAEPYSFGTFKSKLWDVLKDENHKDVVLEREEERAFKCWIDLNVPLWGDYVQRSKRTD